MIDKSGVFFIAHFVLEQTYHAHGSREKYYLQQKTKHFDKEKTQI